MVDEDLDYGSDQEISANHSKLIEAVSQLDKGQRVKKAQRSEPSLEVSEFHLVKSGVSDRDAVRLDDLAKTLGRSGGGDRDTIRKKFQATQKKSKILSKPLEKPAAERLKRIVGFENSKKELNKWNAIVTRNRAAGTLNFAGREMTVKSETTDRFVKRFRLESDLEKELAALEPVKPVVTENVDEFRSTLEEITERRKEAAKFRAQRSYKAAEAYRRNKIKSKKFHSREKKIKLKEQMKEFEKLKDTDPEAALQKLELLDKTRAHERMSLRHRNTGQWAKNKQIRAKYNKEIRQVLAQQLSIGKMLTEKVRNNEEEEEDEEDQEYQESSQVLKSATTDEENPWVNGIKTEAEVAEFISACRNYVEKQNNERNEQKNENEAPTEINTVENVIEIPENPTNVSTKGKIKSGNEKINPVESVIEIPENLTKGETKSGSGNLNPVENVIEIPANPTKLSAKGKTKSESRKGKKDSASTASVSKRKTLKPGSTSQWYVFEQGETLSSTESREKITQVSKFEGIEELFDSMEDKIKSRVSAKLESAKRNLHRMTADDEGDDEKNGNNTKKKYTSDLSFKKQKLHPDVDEELNEATTRRITDAETIEASLKPFDATTTASLATGAALKISANNSRGDVDPNKFINVKPKHLMTTLPDSAIGGEDGAMDDSEDDGDDDNDRHKAISEAFADDDVVDEFRKEKAEEIKKNQPEDIDLRLPGWGSWGGKNIAPSSRKNRRFIMKFPKIGKRRDENKGDVVIIEEQDPKIKAHRVSELPFPFTSVKDYEASIRAPIGRNFVPENAHRRFIKPPIKTKIGAIIEPMDADALIPKNKRATFNADSKSRENIRL